MLKRTYWLAATVALISIALTAACGSGSSSEKDKSAGNTATAQDKQTIAEVKEAFLNLAAAKTFKIAIVAQVRPPTGMITNSIFTYDFVPPDKYQLYTGPTANITRQVGGETFSYDRMRDQWSVLADYSGPSFPGLSRLTDAKRMTEAANAIGTTASVSKGGTDTIEGKTCQLYVLTDGPSQNKTDMCIADKLPLRFVYHSGDLSTTVVFSAFNTDIQIDRPKTN